MQFGSPVNIRKLFIYLFDLRLNLFFRNNVFSDTILTNSVIAFIYVDVWS